MELIKKISEKKLVIMVTHNPELAEKYSTRIVRLLDGQIVEDTNPFSIEDEAKENEDKIPQSKEELEKAKAKMSLPSNQNATEPVVLSLLHPSKIYRNKAGLLE